MGKRVLKINKTEAAVLCQFVRIAVRIGCPFGAYLTARESTLESVGNPLVDSTPLKKDFGLFGFNQCAKVRSEIVIEIGYFEKRNGLIKV